MSSVQDEARVNRALQLQFPSWFNANRPSSTNRGSDFVGSGSETVNCEYVEFYLSTGWVFRAPGLKEFFEELKKTDTKHDVTFDTKEAMFRIRCPRDDQDIIMAIARNTIERIIRTDPDSKKAIPIDVWRKSGFTPAELRELEFFQAPRSILEQAYKSRWDMPQNEDLEQFTINDLLPGDSLSKIQMSTSTVLVVFNQGLATWIGANSEDKIILVKRRLNTLVKYFELQRVEKSEHFFNAEELRAWQGEFRYLAHLKNNMLASFFLDRDIYSPSEYSKLFAKGVTIRLSAWSREKENDASMPQGNIIPASSIDTATKPFRAFSEWKHHAKTVEKDTVMAGGATPRSQNQHSFNDITSWVKRLPEPQTMSEPDTYQQPAEKTDQTPKITSTPRDRSEARDLPDSLPAVDTRVVDEVPEAHGLISDLPTDTANIGGVSEASIAESTIGLENFAVEERLAEIESQMISLAQETGDTLSMNGTQVLAVDAPPDEEQRNSLENSEPFKDPAHIPESCSSSDPAPPSINMENNLDGGAEDPFLSLYLGVRPPSMARNSAMKTARVQSSTPKVPEAPRAQCVPLAENDMDLIDLELLTCEKENRKFHNTMCQKAGSRSRNVTTKSAMPVNSNPATGSGNSQVPNSQVLRTLPAHTSRRNNLDPEFLSGINQALVRVLRVLRMCPGKLSLKAQIGRFAFIRVNKGYVQVPNRHVVTERLEPDRLKQAVDLHHVGRKALLFTRILTTDGGDANYIADIKESDGTRMWVPVRDGRRSAYEFPCEAQTSDGQVFRFVLEVDTTNFSYRIRQLDEKPHMLFVHCMKRSWDFQLEVSATQNLEKIYENFARDLVDSLRVTIQKSGLPRLDFKVKKGFQVYIGIVRLRNTAACTRRGPDTSALGTDHESRSTVLEISEVHDMITIMDEGEENCTRYCSKPFPGNLDKGHPSMWFEAAIQSKAIISAFKENEDLELGDEAAWSAEALCNAGAFEDLVKAANDTVKQMDGVGYWSDNHQDTMIHNRPPGAVQEVNQQYYDKGAYKEVYW